MGQFSPSVPAVLGHPRTPSTTTGTTAREPAGGSGPMRAGSRTLSVCALRLPSGGSIGTCSTQALPVYGEAPVRATRSMQCLADRPRRRQAGGPLALQRRSTGHRATPTPPRGWCERFDVAASRPSTIDRTWAPTCQGHRAGRIGRASESLSDSISRRPTSSARDSLGTPRRL